MSFFYVNIENDVNVLRIGKNFKIESFYVNFC